MQCSVALRCKCSRALVGTRRWTGALRALTPADASVGEGAESVAEGGGDTVRKGGSKEKKHEKERKRLLANNRRTFREPGKYLPSP